MSAAGERTAAGVRFRFTAKTRDGEERAGSLTADDRESAARQLERRGLTVHNLETASDVFEASPTVRMPASPIPPVLASAPREGWRQHLAGLDGRRLGLAALALVLFAGLAWGSPAMVGWGTRLSFETDWRVQGSGQPGPLRLLATRSPAPCGCPRRSGTSVRAGCIFAKDKDGKWQTLEQRAKVDYQGSNEGNYTLTVDVALPDPPEGATLDFSARGYSRVRKQVVFNLKENFTLARSLPWR